MLVSLIRHFGVDHASKLFVLYATQDFFLVDGKKLPIVTALPRWVNKLFLQWSKSSLWGIRWLFDYRNLMFFYPLLCWLLRRKIQQAAPSHLVISSFATAKNVVPAYWWHIPTTLYVHSPMQYIWENFDEYMGKLTGMKRQLFRVAAGYLRPRDKQPRVYTTIYANSSYTARCVEKYYALSAKIRYPQLDKLFSSTPAVEQPRTYFLYIWRLVRFIREVDRVITLCNTLQLPLLVAWSWPDEAYLQSIAWPTITFVWHIWNTEEKIAIMKHARWLINLAKESCGIATMEALSLGVPVFGYAQWGSREIVARDETQDELQGSSIVSPYWVLVQDKSPQSVVQGMQLFVQQPRERKKIQQDMQMWSTTHIHY